MTLSGILSILSLSVYSGKIANERGREFVMLTVIREDKKDIFRYPVTAELAPGYFDVVKQPMDMTTMRKKLDDGIYTEAQPFWVKL